jgi:hypothetical protein
VSDISVLMILVSLQKRLDIFFNEALHLLDDYREQRKLVTIKWIAGY